MISTQQLGIRETFHPNPDARTAEFEWIAADPQMVLKNQIIECNNLLIRLHGNLSEIDLNTLTALKRLEFRNADSFGYNSSTP